MKREVPLQMRPIPGEDCHCLCKTNESLRLKILFSGSC